MFFMTRRALGILAFAPLAAFGEDPLSGKWDMSMETPGGERKAVPIFNLLGEKVGGKWDASDVKGTFQADKLELDFPLTSNEAGYQAPFKVSAKLEAGTLNGTWSWATYNGKLTGKKL